jgi:hypothetical protein
MLLSALNLEYHQCNFLNFKGLFSLKKKCEKTILIRGWLRLSWNRGDWYKKLVFEVDERLNDKICILW